MKPRLLSAIVWGFVALLALVCSADFGSFRMDQPFLARSGTTDPCAGISFPEDSMGTYSNLVYLDGLSGGCNWPEAYADHPMTNLPALFHLDQMDNYTAGDSTAGLAGWHPIAPWTNSTYVLHTYEDLPVLRFVDAFSEYSASDNLNGLVKGTNWIYAQITNSPPIVQTWTNAYVDKDQTNVTFDILLLSARDRFVSSDFTNGETVVRWTNKIASISLTNGDAAKRPTNSSSGIWFDSTHILTNASLGGSANHSWWIVCKVIQIPGANSKIWIDRAGYEVGLYMTLGATGTIQLGLGYTGWIAYGGYIATNIVFDAAISWVPAVEQRFYTNGIFNGASANGGGVTWDGQRFGDVTAWINWYVQEIIVFTNRPLYLEENYALHKYRTNTYGGSP